MSNSPGIWVFCIIYYVGKTFLEYMHKPLLNRPDKRCVLPLSTSGAAGHKMSGSSHGSRQSVYYANIFMHTI